MYFDVNKIIIRNILFTFFGKKMIGKNDDDWKKIYIFDE